MQYLTDPSVMFKVREKGMRALAVISTCMSAHLHHILEQLIPESGLPLHCIFGWDIAVTCNEALHHLIACNRQKPSTCSSPEIRTNYAVEDTSVWAERWL